MYLSIISIDFHRSMLWAYGHYKRFTLSVQNMTSIDVRFYRRQILTSKVDSHAEKVYVGQRKIR